MEGRGGGIMALCSWFKEDIECKHPSSTMGEKVNQMKVCEKCREEIKKERENE